MTLLKSFLSAHDAGLLTRQSSGRYLISYGAVAIGLSILFNLDVRFNDKI
ncbi:hypothetical protein [Melghiribacillus thermohalophilus]|nr:hypothetical protein [Melghiribacillus thermohalophilus]